MSRRVVSSIRRESGTASIELVAAVPFLLLAALVAAQLAATGHALWSAGVAARAGARAELVGGEARRAARRALPPTLRTGATVAADDGVSVGVIVPRLLPGLPVLRVESRTDLEAGGG